MKFKKEWLQNLHWEDHEDDVEIVENNIVDTSRWSIHHDMVFKFDDKFYSTSYSVGATESQYEDPYEYEEDDIECVEVAPTTKTITVYKPIK